VLAATDVTWSCGCFLSSWLPSPWRVRRSQHSRLSKATSRLSRGHELSGARQCDSCQWRREFHADRVCGQGQVEYGLTRFYRSAHLSGANCASVTHSSELIRFVSLSVDVRWVFRKVPPSNGGLAVLAFAVVSRSTIIAVCPGRLIGRGFLCGIENKSDDRHLLRPQLQSQLVP